MIAFETFELILCQLLSSQGKNAPSNPYPHYLVRLGNLKVLVLWVVGTFIFFEPFSDFLDVSLQQSLRSGVARGLLQGRPLQLPMHGELARS